MRFFRALAIGGGVLALLVLALVLTAAPASAHAVLEGSTPADEAVVQTSPAQVVLRFGEPVTVSTDSVQVYDDQLRRVDTGSSGHVDGKTDTAAVRVRPGLRAGTYTVTFRIVSADTHPVMGGLTFSVRHRSTVVGAPGRGDGSRLVGVLLGLSRLAVFLGIVGLGLLTMLLLLWPAGRDDRRARAMAWTGWGLLLVGTAASLLLQGAYAAGTPITHLHLPETVRTRFGVLCLIRLGLLEVVAVAITAWHRPRWPLPAVVGAGLGVLVTVGLAGHAGTGAQWPLALVSDVAHLGAMAVWLGGLALIVGCLLPTRRAPDLAAVLPRFSRWAFAAVVVIVASGTYQSWREVGAWDALVQTAYGRLLLAKICCVDALVALGYLARQWIARHYLDAAGPLTPRRVAFAQSTEAPPAPPAVGSLRRGLLAEVVLGVTVLALTTVLVNTAQAKEAFAPRFATTTSANGVRLHVTVDRAHTGPATLTLTAPGHRLRKVTGSLSLPAQHVGPLPIRFAAGHAPVAFSVPGRWLLDVTVQTSPTDATAFRIAIPVR